MIDRTAMLMESATVVEAEQIYEQIDRYYLRWAGDRAADARRPLLAILEAKKQTPR